MTLAQRTSRINAGDLVAIDVHVHAMTFEKKDESTFGQSASKYFGAEMTGRGAETIGNYYRERRTAAVIFSVDEALSGAPFIGNDQVAAIANRDPDLLIPFASINPHRGVAAVEEARRLIADGVICGFKFHPPLQEFFANDRMAYPLYEVIAAAGLPALFHTGHSGIGTRVRAGGGVRQKYGNPMYLDDVAVDFPDMPIIMAHPSFPWQDEALSVCLHKPQVYIDLSGWSPKYFPPNLVQYANTLLKDKMLFGSDFPVITPDRWMKDFDTIGIKEEVRPLILRENAIRLFGLNDHRLNGQ
jgi:predicted TIM-barrel fold metal-dependent hydrolase